MDSSEVESRKARAQAWFETLRDEICAAFEKLEDEAPASLYPREAARFVRTPWQRHDHSGAPGGGGGVMSMMHGRLFEKVGVHCSTVFGEFAPGMSARADSRRVGRPAFLGLRHFADRASAQPAHPRRAHEHAFRRDREGVVRRRRRPDPGARIGSRTQDDPDTIAFHAAMKAACGGPGGVADYDRYKKWCDEHFYLPHRKEPRGIGGIFYDHHDSGDWDADFAFTKDVGRAFLDIYPELVRRNFANTVERKRIARSS